MVMMVSIKFSTLAAVDLVADHSEVAAGVEASLGATGVVAASAATTRAATAAVDVEEAVHHADNAARSHHRATPASLNECCNELDQVVGI